MYIYFGNRVWSWLFRAILSGAFAEWRPGLVSQNVATTKIAFWRAWSVARYWLCTLPLLHWSGLPGFFSCFPPLSPFPTNPFFSGLFVLSLVCAFFHESSYSWLLMSSSWIACAGRTNSRSLFEMCHVELPVLYTSLLFQVSFLTNWRLANYHPLSPLYICNWCIDFLCFPLSACCFFFSEQVGARIRVFGRDFLIYDCDDFTKEHYRKKYSEYPGVCIDVYICIYIDTCIYVHMYIYIYIYICM